MLTRYRHTLIAGFCGFGLWAQPAAGQEFVGIGTSIKVLLEEDCDGIPCPPIDCGAALGLTICNVYAEFDALDRESLRGNSLLRWLLAMIWPDSMP